MKKKRLSQTERRTQIIEVAMRLFANKGFKGTTTRAIAKLAGVSEAIIFRHFETKEDLYDAIISHTIEKRVLFWEQDESNLYDQNDLEVLLRNFAETYIMRNRTDPTFIRLMMYSALEDHKFREKFLQINRSHQMTAIRRALDAGIKNGTYRPVDAHLTIRTFFWTLLQYCTSQFIARTRSDDPDRDRAVIDNLVGIFINGLIAVPASRVEST